MFVRVKKHNDKEYAYLVENAWTEKGTRQKTKKYLGRLIDFHKNTNLLDENSPEKGREYDLEELKQLDFDTIIKKLLEIELLNLGFRETSEFVFKRAYNKKRLLANLKELVFIADKNKFVIKNREGFICKETIENLLNMRIDKKETEVEERNYLIKNLLKNLLEVGLKPEKEILVLLHDKYLEKVSKQ